MSTLASAPAQPPALDESTTATLDPVAQADRMRQILEKAAAELGLSFSDAAALMRGESTGRRWPSGHEPTPVWDLNTGDGPTLDEIRSWPAMISVPRAGLALRISRPYSYSLAREGRFPCKIVMAGNRMLVPLTALLKVLGG